MKPISRKKSTKGKIMYTTNPKNILPLTTRDNWLPHLKTFQTKTPGVSKFEDKEKYNEERARNILEERGKALNPPSNVFDDGLSINNNFNIAGKSRRRKSSNKRTKKRRRKGRITTRHRRR